MRGRRGLAPVALEACELAREDGSSAGERLGPFASPGPVLAQAPERGAMCPEDGDRPGAPPLATADFTGGEGPSVRPSGSPNPTRDGGVPDPAVLP